MIPAPAPEQHVSIDSANGYCALALPTTLLAEVGARPNAGILNMIQAMEAARKPVIYMPVATTAATPRAGGVPFNMRRLLADTWHNWNAIDAPRLGAALAYYTLLSLAPLAVLIVSVTGIFLKRTMVLNGVVAQVDRLMGRVVASMVSSVLQNSHPFSGMIAGAVSIVLLLLGASGLFLELRDCLDTVWGVRPAYGTGLLALIQARAFAFLTIIGTGLIVTLLILIAAVLATPAHYMLQFLPENLLLTRTLTVSLSLLIMTVIFALIYKALPDIYIRWGDVWIGAFVTSVLFTAGKTLIEIYLSAAGIGSPYAAAGSLILFLTWVYYSAQIFLFGAEFTHVFAFRHGSYSKPRQPTSAGARHPEPSW